MKKILIAFFVTGMVGAGCSKSFLNVNQNPNQPTTVTPNVIFSAALVNTASDNANDYAGLSRWMGYWSRSGNYVPDVQTETYNISNAYTDGEWQNIYLNLNNYNNLEQTGIASGFPFYVGAAKVMKAYCFSTLVDMYNNVPYSDAFNVVGAVQPTYDDAQTIYNALVAQLDSSIYYFDQAKTYYAGAASTIVNTDDQYDVMFGSSVTGDADPTDRMLAWERLANTVELKLLLHQSQVSAQASFIQTEIAKIVANGYGFIGVGQSAEVNPGFQASSGKINPLYANFYTITGAVGFWQSYYRANTYAVNFYETTGDLRQYFVYSGFSLTPGSNYDGDPAAVSNSLTAFAGPGILKGYTESEPILMDFESLFLQAEAAQRGWLPSVDPATAYQTAVEQNYVYLFLDVDATDDPIQFADAYLAGTMGDLLGTTDTGPLSDVNWDASANKLECILTQKWIALNGINWSEAFTDYRRTGYPTSDWLGISHSPTHLEPQIPVRYLYPQTEYNTNGPNVPQLGANAQFTSKIFWNQ